MNKIRARAARLLLAAAVSFSAIVPISAPAAVAAPADGDVKYHLDMGVNQAWSVEGSPFHNFWGATLVVAAELEFGQEVEVVGAWALDESEFGWDSPNCSFNATEYLKNKADYVKNYLPHVSTAMTGHQATASGNKITLRYSVKLESVKEFELDVVLREGKAKQGGYLYGLLGGEDAVRTLQPVIWNAFESAFRDGLEPGIRAYMVFSPTVIAYRDKTPPPPPQAPMPDLPAGTGDTLYWAERRQHTVTRGDSTFVCNHVYSYRARLATTATLTPDTLKSGYGFEVKVTNEVTCEQIANDGACGESKTKAASSSPKPPQQAFAQVGWDFTNAAKRTSQPRRVELEKESENATRSVFQAPKSKVSMYDMRKIYTNVAIAGTGARPVKHDVKISVRGGGLGSDTFSKDLTKQITINGDMYEDDKVTNARPTT